MSKYELKDPYNPLQMIKNAFNGVKDQSSLNIAKVQCEHILMYTSTEQLEEAIDLVSSLEEMSNIMIENKDKQKH